ncbi:hypothetical protein V5O48_009374 [Marasmius crinis-equi]|uniref:F-box domain-containing protein n=1 Tax=Marasmius crinis-equi TaxID=585013 RepID=A0ABR3FBX8_9AGAR
MAGPEYTMIHSYNINQQVLSSIPTPIYTLPPEILLEIFQWLVESESAPSVRGDGPWRLMGVCTRWKDIVLASPGLWAFITVQHNTHELITHTDGFHDIKSRLRKMLLYSRDRPLTITTANVSPLLHDLAKFSERWEEVHLVVDHSGSDLVQSLRLPNLKQFNLVLESSRSHDGFRETNIELEDTPFLRHASISIRAYAIFHSQRPHLYLPWNQLTHLELDTRYNNLTLTPDPELRTRRIELPSLLFLHSIDDPKVLKGFTAPNLRHLILTIGQDPYRDRRVNPSWSYENAIGLITRSHCTIQTLDFRVITCARGLSHDAVAAILDVSPNLVGLNFNVAHSQNLSSIQWSRLGTRYSLETVRRLNINVSLRRTNERRLLQPEVYEEEEERDMEFVREVMDADPRIVYGYTKNAEALLTLIEERLPSLERLEINSEPCIYLEWFQSPAVLQRLRQLSWRLALVIPNVDYSELDSFSGTLQGINYNINQVKRSCTLPRVISFFSIATLLFGMLVPK